MNFHLQITTICNLNCSYCGGGEIDVDEKINYSITDLNNFLQKVSDKGVINFYGGEPLLNIEFIEKVMDTIKGYHFVIQTNGILLHKLKNNYLNKFQAILVSLDGRPKITNNYRGKNVYERVIKNVSLIKKKGFKGDLVARMTASELTDIFEDVTYLLNLKNPRFDHVHWQCDFMWDDSPTLRWNNITEWIEESYLPGLGKLVEYWIEEMKQGNLLGIVPFIPITKTLLTGEKTNIRCGSGYD
ncbi:MAG: TIGR04084 family radical SAM/SPASM domain-containing protein, partial [Candidatus Odinarchaeia archaeon]